MLTIKELFFPCLRKPLITGEGMAELQGAYQRGFISPVAVLQSGLHRLAGHLGSGTYTIFQLVISV